MACKYEFPRHKNRRDVASLLDKKPEKKTANPSETLTSSDLQFCKTQLVQVIAQPPGMPDASNSMASKLVLWPCPGQRHNASATEEKVLISLHSSTGRYGEAYCRRKQLRAKTACSQTAIVIAQDGGPRKTKTTLLVMPPTLEHSALAASRTSPNVRGSIRSKKASSKTQSSTPPTTVGPHRNTRASRAKRNVSGKRRPIQSATSNTDFNEVSRGLISGITNPSHPTEATSKHPSYHSTHAYHYATALADQAYQAAHFLPSGPTGRSIQQHASGELPWIMPTPQLAPTLGTLVGADYIPRRYLVTKFRKMGYKYFGDVNSADCWIGVYGPSVAPETQPQETPQDPVDGTDDSTSPLPPPVSSQAHSDDRPSSHVLYGLIPAHSAFLSGLSPFFSRCLSSARRDLAAGVIRPVPGPLLRLHDLQVADLNNSTVTHKYPLYRPTNGDDADGTATSPKPHSEGAPASSHQTGPLVTTPVLPHETVPLPHQIFLPVAPPSCEALVPLIHWLYVKDVTALRSFLARHDDTAPSAVKATALWLGLDIDAEFWQVMDGWESDVKEGRVILDDMA